MNDARSAAPTLVILAGGRGSRYGGAKQFAPVGPSDEPLSGYALHDAAAAGIRRAVLVCPPGAAPRARSELALWAPPDLALTIVEQPRPPERTRPWGTAHAVLAGGSAVGAVPFAVANADDFYGRGAFDAVARFFAEGADDAHALVAYRLERTMRLTGGVSRAVCAVRDGLLVRITEMHHVEPVPGGGPATGVEPVPGGEPAGFQGRRPDGAIESMAADTRVSMNMWAFRPPFLDGLGRLWSEFRAGAPGPGDEFALPDAVSRLLEEGLRVRVLDTDEEAFGLTAPGDLPRVRAAITERVAAGLYARDLRSG